VNIPEKHALGITPQPGEPAVSGESAWRYALHRILMEGKEVSPRGHPTLELLHEQLITIDMARAVVTAPGRKLSYQFMAAEALWMAEGSDDVEPLARFAPSMRNYSDDGRKLFGAYGPRINAQFEYVVKTLLHDKDTRQAALTIWQPNPPATKDVPCTVAMVFSIRGGRLYQHVFMRSSDIWLGVPYDMFSFSTVGLRVACAYNVLTEGDPILPGHLTISMTSSHLYLRNREAAEAVLASSPAPAIEPVPDRVIMEGRWPVLAADLMTAREMSGAPVTWKVTP